MFLDAYNFFLIPHPPGLPGETGRRKAASCRAGEGELMQVLKCQTSVRNGGDCFDFSTNTDKSVRTNQKKKLCFRTQKMANH